MDLTKILKVGDKIYTPLFGDIEIRSINPNKKYSIKAYAEGFGYVNFTSKGQAYEDGPECLLFPSKENRDWNTFKRKKEITFKPFDKVLVRDSRDGQWRCTIFSHYIPTDLYPFITAYSFYKHCIPYNSETEHLVGTTEDCPSEYKIWE